MLHRGGLDMLATSVMLGTRHACHLFQRGLDMLVMFQNFKINFLQSKLISGRIWLDHKTRFSITHHIRRPDLTGSERALQEMDFKILHVCLFPNINDMTSIRYAAYLVPFMTEMASISSPPLFFCSNRSNSLHNTSCIWMV